MRPGVWLPPVEASPAEQLVMKRVRRAKLFVFLREHRHELFDEAFQGELAGMYADRARGHPPVPPAQLALAVLLQAYTGVGDDEAVEACVMDRRWQLVLDCLEDTAGQDTAGQDTAGQDTAEKVEACLAVARTVRDQDVARTAAGTATLRRGVAPNRRISVEDEHMRHGRKTRSVRVDGYKRHALRDLDTGLIRAVGITAANAPEASVTDAIGADLAAQGAPPLAELHIDRAYLPSSWVRERGEELVVYCQAFPVRAPTGPTGPRFPKTPFVLDFDTGQLTCPNAITMPFVPGQTVHFPAAACHACPLRARCTTSDSGRSVSIHPDERLLAELRERQATPAGRAKLRERVRVEHTPAHLGHWQGAAPATAEPARTSTTPADAPSCTTSTSSPANRHSYSAGLCQGSWTGSRVDQAAAVAAAR